MLQSARKCWDITSRGIIALLASPGARAEPTFHWKLKHFGLGVEVCHPEPFSKIESTNRQSLIQMSYVDYELLANFEAEGYVGLNQRTGSR